MELQDRVAVVTGASRGIGRQVALTLASMGATVIVNYSGSEDKANEVVDAIAAMGQRAEAFRCDVSNYDQAKELIDYTVRTYGHLDILVNNAGITKDGLLLKMTEADFDCVLDVNLKGTFHCIKHVAKQMLKQRSGRIINMSSVSGILGNMGQTNYSASKAGVIGLTKAAARELATRGITVNAVAPGFIDTEMTEVLGENVKAAVTEQIPMKKFGNTQNIADAVAFLASDKAQYITGQVLCVDGGMAM